MKHIMSMLNDAEQSNVHQIFGDYDIFLMRLTFAIDNLESDVDRYELPTFNFDRANILRSPGDPIDVQKLSQLCEEAIALQSRVRELRSLIERKSKEKRKPVDEVMAILKEIFDFLVNICQLLNEHKGSAQAMNRVLRYDSQGREIYCRIDPEIITKLKQTKEYIDNWRDKAKRF